MTRPTTTAAVEEKRARTLARFLADESGATAIEYGLIAVIISISIIAGGMGVREELNSILDKIRSGFPAD